MNNAVCLSLPLAIRCAGLPLYQDIALLVPPCIEALAAIIFIWTKRGRGRKHWFLVSDAWLFALLNVATFISVMSRNILPSLLAFEIYDRVLAAASGLPLFFFMLFLLSYAKADLLPILPMRYRNTLSLLLMFCIPPVVVMAELASLLGFTYKLAPSQSSERFVVDFSNDQSRLTWSLFNSIALAVFIIYQASTFFLTGFRIARHFLMERDAAITRRPNQDAMTIKGTGWIAAGIKLGAIETLLAFIPNGWEMILARRLVRLLGRILLFIGLFKGLDQLDGFTLFRAASLDSIEGLPPRRIPVMDSIRDRISSPRFSILGRVSSAPRSLQDAPKSKVDLTNALARIESRSSEGGLQDKKSIISAPIISTPKDEAFDDFDSPRPVPTPPARPRPARVRPPPDPNARVTLHYDGQRAPTLVMRFSALEMPSPATMLAVLQPSPSESKPSSLGETKKVREKEVIKRRAMSTYAQPIPNPFDDPDMQSLRPLRRASTQVARKNHGSVATTATGHSDALFEVQALASQFPSPPVGKTLNDLAAMSPIPERSVNGDNVADFDEQPTRLGRSSSVGTSGTGHSKRSASVRRKPVPVVSPGFMAQSGTSPAPLPAQPPPMPRTSMEDERAAQIRQHLRKHWTMADVPPRSGAALRSKNSAAASSVTTTAMTNMTMGTSMAPSTPPTAMSFRTAIDSVYDPGYIVPFPEDKPMGKLADRAVDIEAYLEREKERRGLTPLVSGNVAPRTLEDRKVWEREQEQEQEQEHVPSPDLVAHRRPQGDSDAEYPWAQKEDPVMGAKADLEAAWKTATTTARTHQEDEQGGDHSIGQVTSLSRVTTRRQPVVRPVVHSVLSMKVDQIGHSIEEQEDPYAKLVPTRGRTLSSEELEPDSPVDRWQANPYIRS